MDDNFDIQTNIIISGIRSKPLSTKTRYFSIVQLFQVLDEKQLQDVLKLVEENVYQFGNIMRMLSKD